MSDPERELLARTYREYEAAVKAVRAIWPQAQEPTLRQAAADFLEHLRGITPVRTPPTPATDVAPGAADLAPAPTCPECGGPMRDQRATKQGNQPDFKCRRPVCDGATWVDRKRKRSSRSNQ